MTFEEFLRLIKNNGILLCIKNLQNSKTQSIQMQIEEREGANHLAGYDYVIALNDHKLRDEV